jgi:hypothetical protein
MALTTYEEYFIHGISNTGLTAGVGVTFASNSIRIDTDADFNLWKLCYEATNGNILLILKDDVLGRTFPKTYTTLPNIASNFVGTPYILPKPYFFKAGTTLTMDAADNSGVANSLRLALHGAKIKAGLAPWEQASRVWKTYRAMVPYAYNKIVTIAASSTYSINIPIDNDAPFLINKLTGSNSGGNGSLIVDIRNTGIDGVDSSWMNAAIPFQLLFGSGQFPNIMYHNRYCPKLGVITVNAQNLTANALQVEVVFGGIKLFE